jgi:hypothetical protein
MSKGGNEVKGEKRTDSIGGITYSDPTMVTVGFSRQTYGNIEGVSLFGSSVKNHQVISLRITQADLTRNLSSDWIHGDLKPIIPLGFNTPPLCGGLNSCLKRYNV